MSQYVFGTGQLFATPVGGGAPCAFGALQDVSVDFSGDIKQLYGQYQFALDVARGKTKVEWKASTGNVDVNAFNQIFFGRPSRLASELLQVDQRGRDDPATPFQLTASMARTSSWTSVSTMRQRVCRLKQVASAPATGQYSVSAAGVYTFAAADTTTAVLLNYLWDSASTGGSLAVSNQLMGNTPKFQLVLSQLYEGKTFTLLLYSNVADKLTLPLKQDDYLMADLSGQSFADALNRVARISTTSISGGGA
jgi:hypothetical protein